MAGLLLSALGAPAAPAQDTLSSDERRAINFAFATQLGSGIYDVDGRTVQVYRLPLSHTLRDEDSGQWGVRFTFPLTFGFYDFRAADVPQTGLPDDVDTISLVPGVELRVPLREHWLLKPFVEAGLAMDRTASADAAVYAAGVRSLAALRSGGFRVDLGNSLVYTRVDPQDADLTDDCVTLEAASEARHTLGFFLGGREVDLGLYASVDLYFDDPDFPFPPDASSSTAVQYEAGVTFGTVDPARLWKIRLPRLGLGYRFGANFSAVRVVIGLPAPALKR